MCEKSIRNYFLLIYMVTLGEAVQDEVASGKSQQRKNPHSRYHDPLSNQEENTLSVFPEKDESELQKVQSPNTVFSASKCNETGNTHSMISEKVLDNVRERQSSDTTSRDQAFQSSQEGTPLTVISVRVLQRQSPDNTSEDHTCDANQVGTSFSVIAEELSDNLPQSQRSNTGVHTSQSNKEGSSLSEIREKVPDSLQLTQSLNIVPPMLQPYQEGRNPSRITGKASEDGYNWRKYGQKLVKGNEFIRSYYRCTHPNCSAKRQVERSQDGQITDNIYLGKHEHPKPQPSPQIAVSFVLPIHAKRQDEHSLAIGEDKSSDEHDPTSHHAEPIETPRLPAIPPPVGAAESEISQPNRTRDVVDHSGNPDSKRQKRDICNIGETPVEKPNGEPRVVVQTMSEFDIVNDGYRWRKYGQKLVKGNPKNPRSYYRCSNAGCPVKKHVERASHDPKVVITTYEGQHGHDMPPSRTVTPNTAGAYTNTTPLNDESRSGPETNSAVSLDVVVHSSAN